MTIGRIFSYAVIVVGLAACSTAALALDGKLVSVGGGEVVFVWKNKKAQDEAIGLIRAGVHRSNPSLLMPLISCVVPVGTKAVVTSAGLVTQDIIVVEGDKSGCRGNIATEALDMR